MTEIPNTQELAPADTAAQLIAAASMAVVDDSDMELATDVLAQLTAELKRIEAKRKELTGPLLAVKKQLDDAAKQYTRPLSDATSTLRATINAYHQAQLEARQRAEAAREAEQAQTQTVTDPGLLPAAPTKTVNTGQTRASVRHVWTHEVEDEHALLTWAFEQGPGTAGYAIVKIDTVALRALVAADAPELAAKPIPGLRVFQAAQTALRGV